MRIRGVSLVVQTASWGVFALAIGWPAVALIGRCVAQGEPPQGGFSFSTRQLGLLWRSVWLAASATALCVLISIPAAYVVGRVRRLSHRPLIAGLLMVVLLTPPMVCAFGWERVQALVTQYRAASVEVTVAIDSARFSPSERPRRLKPAAQVADDGAGKVSPLSFGAADSSLRGQLNLANYARCIGVWALWAWPIPALLIGTGWARAGRPAFEAAVLATSAPSAFVRAVLPLLLRYIALSGAIVFILFFSDYGVPHACGVLVHATELLGWAQASSRTIDTVWPSTPGAVVVGLALTLIFIFWRRCSPSDNGLASTTSLAIPSLSLTGIAAACVVVSWLVPIGTLVVTHATPATMSEALNTYSPDLAWSLGLALLGGLVAVGMGLGITLSGRGGTVALVGTFVFGALPGALVGEGLIAAYNHDATWWVYDDWPVLVLGYVARFGWVGMLTALFVIKHPRRQLVAQAQTDGADAGSILRHVQLSGGWPTLLGAIGVVAALALAEVATSSMVRVPRFSPVALVLIEKFHRLEYDMLVSLSVWLVAAAVPPAVLLTLAMRRRHGT